ncbi:LysR family transcriptional regulator [uncultured Parasphingorhabdus sp.]|uniref:LysR family transcriptional regulator n=1 Tax=uncultured Parasphingorhabdus sp. TaxID=2709694 RepID=UPI002AA713BC|nr:LysR family transcriptional regulator [uncultured Parasphingorhabdus sp.]
MFPDPLRAFRSVVINGSIRKAGDALGLAPSSVSRQIAILERQMGTALFDRKVNGLQLTYAGRLVSDYAEDVVIGFDSLRADLDDLRGSQRLIKLTMVESVVSAGPAQAIFEFSKQYEHVHFEFEIVPAPAVLEAVRQQNCDVGITLCAEPSDMIATVARVPEPVFAVVPYDHALAQNSEISLAEINDYPVALPSTDFRVRRIFDIALAEAGVRLQPHLQSNSFEALRDFVRSGAGIAVLPKGASLREQQAGRAHCIPLQGDAFKESTLDLIVYKQQRIPRLVRLFIDTLRHSIEADR